MLSYCMYLHQMFMRQSHVKVTYSHGTYTIAMEFDLDILHAIVAPNFALQSFPEMNDISQQSYMYYNEPHLQN